MYKDAHNTKLLLLLILLTRLRNITLQRRRLCVYGIVIYPGIYLAETVTTTSRLVVLRDAFCWEYRPQRTALITWAIISLIRKTLSNSALNNIIQYIFSNGCHETLIYFPYRGENDFVVTLTIIYNIVFE